jgi:hypothetical protein
MRIILWVTVLFCPQYLSNFLYQPKMIAYIPYRKMEAASVAFCYEALRHCYHILGKDRFRAETEFIMKCFDSAGGGAGGGAGANPVVLPAPPAPPTPPALPALPALPAPSPPAEAAPIKEEAKPEPKAEQPAKKSGKWQRTPVPEEERCKRVMPYNGGQCTFKKVEGTDLCTRHTDK